PRWIIFPYTTLFRSKMVYEKNENYYDVDNLGPDVINFVLMDDQNTILSAFKNNEVLFADDLPSEEIEAMTDNGLYIAPQLGNYLDRKSTRLNSSHVS